MTHLFDSSAWLVHLFDEAGVDQVNRLFSDAEVEIMISVLSITEVYARLLAVKREEHWPEIWDGYSQLFSRIHAVDERIAERANRLRTETQHRLPTIDALIAATAAVYGYTLVHRDCHLAAIPANLLKQIELPGK